MQRGVSEYFTTCKSALNRLGTKKWGPVQPLVVYSHRMWEIKREIFIRFTGAYTGSQDLEEHEKPSSCDYSDFKAAVTKLAEISERFERLMEEGREQGETAIRKWIRQRFGEKDGDNLFEDMISLFASLVIVEALTVTGGNRSETARLLGLARPTLLGKMQKYDIQIETLVEVSPGHNTEREDQNK